MKRSIISFILIFCISFISTAQRTPNQLNLRGTLMGYEFDPKQGLFNKQKINIQGTLDAGIISLYHGSNQVNKTVSKSDGDFSMGIPIGKVYELRYTKKGYGKSTVTIDLTNIPEDMAQSGLILKDIELLLNDFESDRALDNGKSFGTIQYSLSSKYFVFKKKTFSKKELLFKKTEDNAPLNLITKSIEKNRKNNIEAVLIEEEDIVADTKPNKNNGNNVTTNDISTEIIKDDIDQDIQTLAIKSTTSIKDINDWSSLTKDDLDNRANEITEAWEQLEKDKLVAVTPEDFLIIQAREELLKAAEKDLKAAEAYISEMDAKLGAQRLFNFALIGLAGILGVFIFFIIKRSKERKKTNAELAAKNKKITDSINYAERIQKSILLSESQIAAILPNSFLFHKPLDVVSGDFYWFSEVDGKTIFAAIDCTGHGVPGAFMSLIGNTLLNQIVNEKKITSPGKILEALHLGIVQSLFQEEGGALSQDGMDMAICTIDKGSNKLAFSGAMNPVFIVQEGVLTELSGNLLGIGGLMRRKKANEIKFKEETVELKKGACVYLFSDGFMDQFGGENNEKFNLGRFRDLLIEIHTLPLSEQKEISAEAFENWKGDRKQLDDVLLIGVKP